MARRPLVVASIPIKSPRDIEIALGIEDADYVELRLDYYRDPESIDYTVLSGRRVIATLREIDEGGINRFSPEFKKNLIKLWRNLGILYDVEASFIERYGVEYNGSIVSIHILEKPVDLNKVLRRVERYIDRALVVKIAVAPFKGYKSFLSRLLELGDNIAVMPMGADPVERIAFALLGSRLVYGYVTEPTAKGQIHYRKIVEILNKIYGSIYDSSPHPVVEP